MSAQAPFHYKPLTHHLQFGDYVDEETSHLRKIKTYVLLTATLLVILYPLSGLKKRFCKVRILHVISSACYVLLPILLSYTLALMGEPGNSYSENGLFRRLYGLWAVLLMIAYASFDNLNAFTLGERNGRTKIVFQFLTQFFLIMLFAYVLPWKTELVPILVAFLVVCLKVAIRVVALAHAAGETRGIRRNLRRMINYTNKDDRGGEADPVRMQGFNYLVGPRYSKCKDGVIVHGIGVEEIWACSGRLLSSEPGGGDRDGKLKDTCLSFALFWSLLGKFWGFPLYKGESSRERAWSLLRQGLLGADLAQSTERVFRVIEVELSFLQDYFYSKYTFYYLNGFSWKLYVFAFPIMFSLFAENHNIRSSETMTKIHHFGYPTTDKISNPEHPTMVLLLAILLLEFIQLFLLVASRWFVVTLLSYYVKTERSKKKCRLLGCCVGKVVEALCRISQCTSVVLSNPWKRELDQYSLLESCTCFSVDNDVLQGLNTVVGIGFLQMPGRKEGAGVALSENVRIAVVSSLLTNGPKLSNGIASLRRNGVEEGLSWACKLECDAEAILVWHIATSFCEMKLESQQNNTQSTEDEFKVATCLSKYCAYLLAFSPSLLGVPVLEAEAMCDIAINEARELFKNKANKCEKLMESLSDKEAGTRATTVGRGAQLGQDLLMIVGDEGRRWKILAEFWAEMILFLTPSHNNEMVHAEKLAEGGQFITHLWALLIHSGIVDRNIP